MDTKIFSIPPFSPLPCIGIVHPHVLDLGACTIDRRKLDLLIICAVCDSCNNQSLIYHYWALCGEAMEYMCDVPPSLMCLRV